MYNQWISHISTRGQWMGKKTEKRVPPYEEKTMPRTELTDFRVYEYALPFNYENVDVVRRYSGGETHGMELNAVNSHSPQPEHLAADYIELRENDPIVYVEVIGSACTPPGYVQLNAEPIEEFRRSDEIASVMPVRFRINNLWGMHLRVDQWAAENPPVPRYRDRPPSYQPLPPEFKRKNPKFEGYGLKTDYREFPLAGMSCALFAIPPSRKIQITAGCECVSWNDDAYPDDVHYSIRIIRVTVCRIRQQERRS